MSGRIGPSGRYYTDAELAVPAPDRAKRFLAGEPVPPAYTKTVPPIAQRAVVQKGATLVRVDDVAPAERKTRGRFRRGRSS